MNLSTTQKRMLIEQNHNSLSIANQCDLLDLPRSTYYYEPCIVDPSDVLLMHRIDELYTQNPFYGSRKMVYCLQQEGYLINRKRVQRLMQYMSIQAVCPKPNFSKKSHEHRIYPYLLRNVDIERSNQVWSTDITYIRLEGGFVYLVAIIDWYSRYVLSWELSNSLDVYFCLNTLKSALLQGKPSIFNTDQGSQFTSNEYLQILQEHEIQISMDGRGRALDNIFIERLWRTLKYENVYIQGYRSMRDAYNGLVAYFKFYNHARPHQSLDYRTPYEVYMKTN